MEILKLCFGDGDLGIILKPAINLERRERPVTIDINIDQKFVDVWLLNGETPPELNLLRELYADYDLTVYRSGTCSLTELTAELLRVNL